MNISFGALLVVVSVYLSHRQIAFWHHLDRETLQQRELKYFRAQFRRRMQVSVLIGIIGVTIGIVDVVKSPLVFSIFFISWLVMLAWIVGLALLDFVSAQIFLGQITDSQRAKKAEMEAQIRELKDQHRTGEENGKGKK